MTEWISEDEWAQVSVSKLANSQDVHVKFKSDEKVVETEVSYPTGLPLNYAARILVSDRRIDIDFEKMPRLLQLFGWIGYRGHERPYVFAPVRSRPKRTYDPIQEAGSEGAHIPSILSKLKGKGGPEWSALISEINQFGLQSGLFSEISIKNYGSGHGEPFQLHVRLPGQNGDRNILDVGYGVSQVLPILVEVALSNDGWLLLQQPEVHLHPRAQAELGTYISRAVARNKARFVIETHSDYLVDRVAIAIRDGVLNPDDVTLLYFASSTRGITIHPLSYSNSGVLIDPPNGYRAFFLEEEALYLGI